MHTYSLSITPYCLATHLWHVLEDSWEGLLEEDPWEGLEVHHTLQLQQVTLVVRFACSPATS